MTEAGSEFGYNDDDEQKVNTTGRLQLGVASTSHYRGEEIEMQTRQHEKSGLPVSSYDETTPLRGSKRSWEA